MTLPHELVDRLQTLPSTEIDLIYNVLLRIEREQIEETPAAIREKFRIVTHEKHEVDEDHDEALDFLLSLCDLDEQGTLYERFERVLQEAGITLEEGSVSIDTSIADPDGFQDLNIKAVRFDRQRLLSQAVEAWRDAVHARREMWLNLENPMLNAQADEFYRFNLLSKALSHWWNTFRETIHPLYIHESDLQARHNDDLLRSMTKEWVLKAREGQFVRVQDMRIAQAALYAMSQRFNEVKALESVTIYEPLLARANLAKWRSKVHNARRMDQRAEDACDYFVMVRSLRKWRSIVASRKQSRQRQEYFEKRIGEIRSYVIKVKFFHKWRSIHRERKMSMYNMAYKTIRTKNKENIAYAALSEWRGKTQYIEAMSEIANDFSWHKKEERIRLTAHGAITSMYNKAMEKKDDESKADRFSQKNLLHRTGVVQKWEVKISKIRIDESRSTEYLSIKDAKLASNTLRKINTKAFEMSRRQNDAQAFDTRQDKKRNLSFLDKWRRAAAEKRGQLDLPPVTPAARRSQLLLGTGHSTTPAYTPFVDRLQGVSGTRIVLEEQDEEEDDVGDVTRR